MNEKEQRDRERELEAHEELVIALKRIAASAEKAVELLRKIEDRM